MVVEGSDPYAYALAVELEAIKFTGEGERGQALNGHDHRLQNTRHCL